MKKYIIYTLLVFCLFLVFAIGIRWWTMRYVQSVSGWLAQKSEVAYLATNLPNDDFVEIEGDSVTILCIGNSITIHPAMTSIGWNSNWGMAASRPENDYVHVLQQHLLNRKDIYHVEIFPVNVIKWEQDFSYDKNILLGEVLSKADVVIIRLGENVPENHLKDFQQALLELVSFCEQQTKKIIITGVFWQHPIKDTALIAVARRTGHPFVPLSWIHELYDSCTKMGDTLFNGKMLPYTIDSEFIIAHPNDEGMRIIAEEIERKIR